MFVEKERPHCPLMSPGGAACSADDGNCPILRTCRLSEARRTDGTDCPSCYTHAVPPGLKRIAAGLPCMNFQTGSKSFSLWTELFLVVLPENHQCQQYCYGRVGADEMSIWVWLLQHKLLLSAILADTATDAGSYRLLYTIPFHSL